MIKLALLSGTSLFSVKDVKKDSGRNKILAVSCTLSVAVLAAVAGGVRLKQNAAKNKQKAAENDKRKAEEAALNTNDTHEGDQRNKRQKTDQEEQSESERNSGQNTGQEEQLQPQEGQSLEQKELILTPVKQLTEEELKTVKTQHAQSDAIIQNLTRDLKTGPVAERGIYSLQLELMNTLQEKAKELKQKEDSTHEKYVHLWVDYSKDFAERQKELIANTMSSEQIVELTKGEITLLGDLLNTLTSLQGARVNGKADTEIMRETIERHKRDIEDMKKGSKHSLESQKNQEDPTVKQFKKESLFAPITQLTEAQIIEIEKQYGQTDADEIIKTLQRPANKQEQIRGVYELQSEFISKLQKKAMQHKEDSTHEEYANLWENYSNYFTQLQQELVAKTTFPQQMVAVIKSEITLLADLIKLLITPQDKGVSDTQAMLKRLTEHKEEMRTYKQFKTLNPTNRQQFIADFPNSLLITLMQNDTINDLISEIINAYCHVKAHMAIVPKKTVPDDEKAKFSEDLQQLIRSFASLGKEKIESIQGFRGLLSDLKRIEKLPQSNPIEAGKSIKPIQMCMLTFTATFKAQSTQNHFEDDNGERGKYLINCLHLLDQDDFRKCILMLNADCIETFPLIIKKIDDLLSIIDQHQSTDIASKTKIFQALYKKLNTNMTKDACQAIFNTLLALLPTSPQQISTNSIAAMITTAQ